MLLDTRADIPPPDRMTNAFVALRPPWRIAERFHANATTLCRRAGIVGRQRPFYILHMTMLPIAGALGRLPDEDLGRIDDAISHVRFPAFDVVLDEARSFETRKSNVPFVLEGGELTDVVALRLAVLDALHVKDLNIPARQAFSPHMTLAYARHRSPRISVPAFSWRACEFQLVESWVGQTKYVELARWKLWDGAPPDSSASAQAPWPRGGKRRPDEDGAA